MELLPRDEEHGQGDFVQFGSPARRYHRWPGQLLIGCLLIIAAVVVITHSASHRRTSPAVTVVSIGHPILGVRAGWELLGLDGRGLVRVEFARGRILRAVLPQLQSDGPVSLVAPPGEALVRPLDNVPGYVVPDGESARPLTGVLAQGGTLLPGPTPDEVWLEADTILLVGPGGERVTAHLPARLLATWAAGRLAIPDGRGGLMLPGGPDILYDASPDGTVRPVHSLLLAVGPQNWLGLTCTMGACNFIVTSATTWTSRVLPGPGINGSLWASQTLPGVVSPDGSRAAVIVPNMAAGQDAWLELISLTSGDAERVPVPVAPGNPSQSLAWSPDSRWLFVVTANGTLAAVDARTGRPRDLHLGLSGLSEIVIRPADG